MASPRDGNRVPTLRGALSTDGTTIVNVQANPTTHRLSANIGSTGSDFGTPNAKRDDDRVPVLMAVSAADGVTPVEIYANISGQLLMT